MEPASSSSASSLVSKAKTAFHSAAARAEKVLTDIKTDLKHDREGEGDSHKAPKKLSEHECNVADKSRGDECYNEFKHSRWKPPHLGIKQEWQHRLKNIKRGRKGVEDKERPESLTPDILALDEYLNHMDPGLEQGSIGVEDASIASNVVSVPPTSVIKQLGVALEAGKKFKSLKDLLASTRGSSPIKERSGLSFSAVKSLVLREKDEKLLPEPDDNEEVLSLIHSLFDACRGTLNYSRKLLLCHGWTFLLNFLHRPLVIFHFHCNICKIFAEEHIPKMENGSCSKIPTTVYLPRDIHGAPPESFVVRLSEIIGSLKSPQRMASFWFNVVAELRRLWSEGQPVPRMPLDEIPDLNYCLLHQQLQVINCCIARERRRIIAVESLDSVMKETNTSTEGSGVSVSNQSSNPIIYARTGTGDVVLRLGADHPSRGLTMLETDEPVYSPVTQEGPILTEDLIRETEEFVLRTGSVGAGCSQLLSDMQAFKAANPGCILEDFVRWHSPPDWTEAKSDDDTKDSFDGGEPSSRKGQLSSRMQKEGNLWRELWETARPLPAVKQTPLFDEDLAVEGILNVLEDISPSELFEQLFVSVLSSSFTIAEAALPSNSDLSKLFYDCKDYLIAICQGDLCSDNIDDLCQVYETVETILLNPEGPSVTKPSEETITNEPRRRFMRISLNFTGNDKQIPCKPAPKDQKKSAEQQTHVFSQFFDGKSSLFGKKTPKPNMSEAGAPSCLDDSDWTIID